LKPSGRLGWITPEDWARYSELQEAKKYYAARTAYSRRNQRCPVPQKFKGFTRSVTWEDWFEVKFGERLVDYVDRIKSSGKPRIVQEWEGKRGCERKE